MANNKPLGITCQNKTDPLVDYKIVIDRLNKVINERKSINLVYLAKTTQNNLKQLIELLK